MTAVLPGGTIGILGGGQLARMMALEARRMGYRVGVLDPDDAGSAAQVADFCVTGGLDDADAARRLASRVEVVTLDVEHIPADVLDAVAPHVPVRPAPDVLRTVQDRATQREFLARHGLPQTRNATFSDEDELAEATRLMNGLAVVDGVVTETSPHELTKRRPTPDSIGMGSYTIDSHNVQRYVDSQGHARNEGDIQVSPGGPYPIGYGAIVPKAGECTNLLVPVCLASSHIAYGSIRMEPVFLILGQSAATAASSSAHCSGSGRRGIRRRASRTSMRTPTSTRTTSRPRATSTECRLPACAASGRRR